MAQPYCVLASLCWHVAQVLYALALVPVGLLADRVDRPRLLSIGIVLWSLLTMLASQAHGFGQLLATRVGFAAAQVGTARHLGHVPCQMTTCLPASGC